VVISELLPAVDNLERALMHVPKDLKNHEYVKGVQGVIKQFEQRFKQLGVERIKTVGEHLPKKMFIIAPDASVKFFEDWVEEGGIKYYILRIPYSIIDEIEKQEFTPLKQPDSVSLLNDIVESVGFDFIEPPEVEAEYSITKPKNKLVEFAQVKIKKFKSNQRSKKEKKVPDEEALSMVLIDSDYDGENFKLTDTFFKDELEENLVQFDLDIGPKIAIVYIDIYGNEKIEVIEKSKFKRK